MFFEENYLIEDKAVRTVLDEVLGEVASGILPVHIAKARLMGVFDALRLLTFLRSKD